jgi:hypothetical protein
MSEFTNQIYGYSIATNKTNVVIGNPSNFVYNSASVQYTGSVEVLKYNNQTDSYTHSVSIRKYINPQILIAIETSDLLARDANGDNFLYEFSQLTPSSSKFGKSVAISNNTIAIGDPFYYFNITNTGSGVITGSSVDLFDVTGSYLTSISNTYDTNYDYNTTFGESVSLYNDILAIGASSISSSTGAVYIYKNIANTWTYYQTLTGSLAITGSKFGGVVRIDQSGFKNIVVGNSATGSGLVYVFSYNTSSQYWNQTSILYPNRNLTQSLQTINNNWPPYITSNTNPDGFGNSVAIYENNIVVGAPTDTIYQQYNGSSVTRYRGAAYFYQNCNNSLNLWKLIEKTYGSSDLLNTNKFGWDVAIYNTSSVVSSLKLNYPYSASYIQNTLYKKFDCNPDDFEIDVLGQVVVFQQNPTSSNWDVITTVTKNKQYNDPYKLYGYSVSLYDSALAVGAPIITYPNL